MRLEKTEVCPFLCKGQKIFRINSHEKSLKNWQTLQVEKKEYLFQCYLEISGENPKCFKNLPGLCRQK